MNNVKILKDGTIQTENGFEIYIEAKHPTPEECYLVFQLYWKVSHVADFDTLYDAVSYCEVNK